MKEWREILLKYRHTGVENQEKHKKEICDAFAEMLKHVASRDTFSKYTSGLVLFPEMLWDMIVKR